MWYKGIDEGEYRCNEEIRRAAGNSLNGNQQITRDICSHSEVYAVLGEAACVVATQCQAPKDLGIMIVHARRIAPGKTWNRTLVL